MPRLFVLSGRDVGRSFEVSEGAVLGRAPDCELQLHDRSVSRRHARLERDGEGWVLVDLASRNGLRVDGERVVRAVLSDHGEVLVGELPLRFRAEEDAPPEAPVASASPVVEPPRAAPPRPARRARIALDEPEDELVLEEEIDLEAPTPEPAASTAPASRLRTRPALDARPGLLGGDLSQRPLWIQLLVYLLVLAFAAGMFYGAFELVAYLRATS